MITKEDFTGQNVLYIGDGVYASYDGFSFWLETSNGEEIKNRICLEPDVLEALILYVQYVRENQNVRQGKVDKG